MTEIPEEAHERATDAIAALVNSWPASASHPFHPALGVRETLRSFAIVALEAAALPHLRVQETAIRTDERRRLAAAMSATCERLGVDDEQSDAAYLERHFEYLLEIVTDPSTAPKGTPVVPADSIPPAPRPVVDREAVIRVIGVQTGHVEEWDTSEETGERVSGCYSCAGFGYPCRTLSDAADAVLALLPTEEGEGS
jgi:hypothetical protein